MIPLTVGTSFSQFLSLKAATVFCVSFQKTDILCPRKYIHGYVVPYVSYSVAAYHPHCITPGCFDLTYTRQSSIFALMKATDDLPVFRSKATCQ